MLHRKRKQERIEKERNEDICVSPEQKPSVKPKKREFKRKGKKSEEEEETKLADIENDKVKAANGAIEEEDDSAELRLVDELTLNLNDDPSLFQIDDVDLNYIVFNWKPLVLSTENQLQEQCDKEMEEKKGGKQKSSKASKSKKFDTFVTMDSLSKKEADTIGSLLSKSTSIQSIIESSCKRSMKEFLQDGQSNNNKTSISSRRSKRIKNEVKVDEDLAENVYFDPIISLYFYFRQHLLSEKWNERQYWWANLVSLTKCIKFNDFLSRIPDLANINNLAESLKIDLCTRAIVLTLVDHFSDFQENRLIAPVRELSVKLMVSCLHIIPIKAICGTLLASPKLYWMYKFNVLLILKTMMIEGRRLVESAKDPLDPKILTIQQTLDDVKENRKILDNVCKWLKSEDEVKILACECIEQMVDTFINDDSENPEEGEEEEDIEMKDNLNTAGNSLGVWGYNGTNYNLLIEQVLNDSDDIECTAISVFNLLIRIARHEKFDCKKFIDLSVSLPFNFHRMIQVRISFTIMMKEITRIENENYQKSKALKFFNTEILSKVFLMGIQACIMEQNKTIVSNWLQIIKNIWMLCSDIDENTSVFIQLLDYRFYEWLSIKIFPHFANFMFMSNDNFESIPGYYQLVTKPVTNSEIEANYLIRQLNGAKWLAIVRAYTKNNNLQNSVVYQMINRASLVLTPYGPLQPHHLLFYYNLALIENKEESILKGELLKENMTDDLFVVLDQITSEKYYVPLHQKYNEFVKLFQDFGDILFKEQVDAEFGTLFQSIASWVNNIGQGQPDCNAMFFENVEKIYKKTREELKDKASFKLFFGKISEVYEIINTLQLEATRYVMTLKTIIASTIVQVGMKNLENLNKIVRPLLTPLKSGKINKCYQKMSGKSLVYLISNGNILETSKFKIIRCIINYIEIDPSVKDPITSLKTGAELKHSDPIFDRISSYTGANAFFHYYSKTYGYENMLEANDNLLAKIIQEEFNSVPKGKKEVLIVTDSNQFYKFIIKIRTLFNIWRDLNKKLTIKSISAVVQSVIDFLDDIKDNDTATMLSLTEVTMSDGSANTLVPSQTKFLQGPSRILGEALAKNLIDRKIILEFIFKLIEVDQQDQALKEIGRDAIDVALQFAEDDDSVDMFKYLPWFIIPVLKNSSTNKHFSVLMARLFKLLPLNKAGVFDKDVTSEGGFNPSAEYEQGFEFLKVLSNKRSSNKEQILKNLNAKEKIREYQEHGISWIVSLTDFGFNWALCDDMGLGKTFQALASVSIKIKEKRELTKQKHSMLSLVICPSTLIHNWNNEIKKFFSEDELKGEVYEDTMRGFDYKNLKKSNLPKTDILIMSYEKIRTHAEFFKNYQFLYVILDEAHLIKNSKSMTTQAIKTLKAERKLILTGTPLQNRVTELWSIFDFLMPGFLEDESTFNKKYTKYLSTNLKKLGESEKETEQFLKSIQSLRERIAPFILRRTKANVMKELPPKIIQDYKCPLTDSQAYLHDILEKIFPYTEGMKSIDTKASDIKKNQNAIENLLAHRRLCNHPSFILDDKKIMGKIYDDVDEDLFRQKIKQTMENQQVYEQSGKLRSLLSLLEECGMLNISASGKVEAKIIKKTTSNDTGDINTSLLAEGDNNSHRALIFWQMKKYLYMIENEIMKRFQIPYLVLDATLNPKQRFEAAEKFNNHSKYKVMLLSTNIGSLGLNLTGADTVIFMEHDWNPMKDLQAIDRAHRIGQTKTVTVYRLISMGTLEEKIMNLQRFKKKLHRMLIVEKQTTGTGEDKEEKVEVANILKSFENQDAFKAELNKNISSSTGIQIDEDEVIDNERENFLSKMDKDWLNLENK